MRPCPLPSRSSGDVDLAAEAIRLTRQLGSSVNDPEVHGLLALMLLHHARRRSRTGPDGRIVPLADQDQSLWDDELIAEGIAIVQAALARDRLGEYQAQAAIAALHADARRVEDTDWVQRAHPAARCDRRVSPREEWRSRTRGPPLCRRRRQRAQPRGARSPDAPSCTTQPNAAPPPMTGAVGRTRRVRAHRPRAVPGFRRAHRTRCEAKPAGVIRPLARCWERSRLR